VLQTCVMRCETLALAALRATGEDVLSLHADRMHCCDLTTNALVVCWHIFLGSNAEGVRCVHRLQHSQV
jgi:hypothetical protein